MVFIPPCGVLVKQLNPLKEKGEGFEKNNFKYRHHYQLRGIGHCYSQRDLWCYYALCL